MEREKPKVLNDFTKERNTFRAVAHCLRDKVYFQFQNFQILN